MRRKLPMKKRGIFLSVFLILLMFAGSLTIMAADAGVAKDLEKRKTLLIQLLAALPPDPHWNEWLYRTGELPPDFDLLPSSVDLPDPLLLEEGGKLARITTQEQWARKREVLKELFQRYVTGRFPPAPNNLEAEVLHEVKDGTISIRDVLLKFGPEHQARLSLQLFVPEGPGPFPVFVTCTGKRSWVEIGLRRGYMGCIVSASDGADDTERWQQILIARDLGEPHQKREADEAE